MTGATPSLWRRNVGGAVVLGASLTVVTATQLWPAWSDYRTTVVPEQTVGRGESATIDGQHWQVESVRRIDGSETTPKGAVETVVTLGRSGPTPDQDCSGVLTDGASRWDPERFPNSAGDVIATSCLAPGPLQLVFQTPADVTPTAVDIVRSDRRIVLRLFL